jgi:hypothetical protein
VRSFLEAKTSISRVGVFESVPETHGAGWICVEEGAVLMGGDFAAYFGLLADNHTLEDAGVSNSEGLGNEAIPGRE